MIIESRCIYLLLSILFIINNIHTIQNDRFDAIVARYYGGNVAATVPKVYMDFVAATVARYYEGNVAATAPKVYMGIDNAIVAKYHMDDDDATVPKVHMMSVRIALNSPSFPFIAQFMYICS